MTERTRRALLGLCGTALCGLAGCLQSGGSDDGTPTEGEGPGDGTATDTPGPGTPSHTPGDGSAAASVSFDGGERLHRVAASFPQRDVGDYHLALLRTSEEATAFGVDRLDDASARALVADTDFEAACVVVLHDRLGSSHPDLELAGAAVDGRTVTVEARYPGTAGSDDVRPNTLVARVETERDVDAARCVLNPQYGDAVRFATLSAYADRERFDPAGDLVVRNRDCATARPRVVVTYEGDLFHRSGRPLDPASTRVASGLFSYGGEWTVRVAVDDQQTIERTWSLEDAPPGDVLVDVAGDGSISVEHRADGVGADDPDTCETSGYPYESSDPAENLADPVDLWAIDRSEGSRRLTVTVRDGSTDVWSGTFDLGEGYDKARRANLLAKKTTYEVAVEADDGDSVSESVTIDADSEKIVARVAEDGSLRVHAN